MRNALFTRVVVTAAVFLCGVAAWHAKPTFGSREATSGADPAPPRQEVSDAAALSMLDVEETDQESPVGCCIFIGSFPFGWKEVQLSDPQETGFRFSDDHAGKLLAKVLPPSGARPTSERATDPRPYLGAAQVESPSLPLPQTGNGIPRVALADHREPRPHLVMEEVFVAAHAEALLPAVVVLEAAERVRVPSVDVNKPTPLPILAKPSSDRAPVEDVTGEASSAAVVSGAPPARTKPVPFLKLTLPDPFENRRPVAPPVTPSEEVPNTPPRLP